MSVDHVARLNLIRDNLQAFLQTLPTPACNRLVTRSWKPLNNVPDDQIKAGTYTLIATAATDFANYNGANGEDGTIKLVLIGRFKMPEKTTGEQIENAEWEMFDNEVRPWLQRIPLELCCLEVKEVNTSGQLQHPYGVVGFVLEECTS